MCGVAVEGSLDLAGLEVRKLVSAVMCKGTVVAFPEVDAAAWSCWWVGM